MNAYGDEEIMFIIVQFQMRALMLLLLSCEALLTTTLSFPTNPPHSAPPGPPPTPPHRLGPVCLSQLALANYACASVIPGLPAFSNPPPTQPGTCTAPPCTMPDIVHLSKHDDDYDDNEEEGREKSQRHKHHHNHHHPHHHGHHRSRNVHESGHHNDENDADHNVDDDYEDDRVSRELGLSSEESNCCKWVSHVDDQCVCNLLSWFPASGGNPIREYTLITREWFKVTCGGRGRKP